MTLACTHINILDVETWVDRKHIEGFPPEEGHSRVEQELLEKELFFKAVINAIPDSFAVLSADGIILFVNEYWKSFAAKNGGGAGTGPGSNYLDVCKKAAENGALEAIQFLQAFETLVQKGSSTFTLEYPCHSPVEKRWFRVRVHKTEEADETLYLVVHENITERKRQLELQEKNNALFETITTGARVGILIAGFDGRVIEHNRAVREMLGYDEGETFDWRRITPPEYLAQDEQVAAQIKKEGAAGLFVKEFWRKDGTRITVGIGGKTVNPAKGEVLCYMIDLSEKKALELQFTEAQRKFAAVSESMRNLLVICDSDLRIAYANAAFRAEFAGDLLDSSLAESLPQSVAGPLAAAAALVLQDKAARSLEIEWNNGSTKRHFLADVSVIEGARGSLSVFVLLYDATALKANEVQLRLARDAAERAMNSRTEFLSMISHELRSPLSAVLGITDLLEKEPLTPVQKDYMKLIRSQGEDLLRIIKDVLDFGRLAAGKMEVHIRTVALRSFLDEIASVFGPRIRSKGLEWSIDIAPDVPDAISSDPVRLRQILSNLLTNALKFTAAGSVSLQVHRSADPRRLLFVVADTGIGIKQEQAARLFSAFSQAAGEIDRIFGGTGLGLSVSQELAGLLGGQISFQSEYTRGSTFTLDLPARIADEPSIDQMSAKPAEERTLCAHVLLVEDNAVNLMVMEAMLRQLGVTFESAKNGKEAAEMLAERASRFDIILTDLELEDMSGFEFIRSIPLVQPVAAVSAYSEAEMAVRCREAGFADYIEKPVRLQSLGHLLERLLAKRKPPELA